jgi:gamma-glutamyl hydrolase
MLMMAAEQDESLLKQDYDAENFAWPLLFPTEDNVVNSHGVYSIQSQLYNTSQLRYNLQEFNMTFNAHKKGLQPQTFVQNSKLADMFYITSTNYDAQMQPFVSTMEAKDYPFYGVQYHPEKNNFEYGFQLDKHDVRRPYEDIPHSMESVQLSLHLALFFVNLARNNHGRYSKIDEYPPIYTYPMVRGGGKFEHVYLVPSAEHWEPDGMEPELPPLHNKNSLLRGGNTLLTEAIA